MVPQHGPFSLHTMLEGPRLHKMAIPTPTLNESQGPLPLHGHSHWLVCQVALIFFDYCISRRTQSMHANPFPTGVPYVMSPPKIPEGNIYG